MKKFSEFVKEKDINEESVFSKIGSTISNMVAADKPTVKLSPRYQQVINNQRYSTPTPSTLSLQQLLKSYSVDKQQRIKQLQQDLTRALVGKEKVDNYSGQNNLEAANKVIQHISNIFNFTRLEDEARAGIHDLRN